MEKTGRNDPCPCGSRKKYKHCCMNNVDQLAKGLLNTSFQEDKNCENSINFIFDTNAHSFLITQPDFSNIIKTSIKKTPLIPHFSAINFYEYLNGINTNEELKKRQSFVKKCYMSTLSGTLFLSTNSHMQDTLGLLDDSKKRNEAVNLINYIKYFLTLKNHADFKYYFQPLQDESFIAAKQLAQNIKLLTNKLTELKKEFRKNSKMSVFKNQMNGPPIDNYDSFLPLMFKKFKLPTYYSKIDKNMLFEQLPSIKYYIDVLWKYVCHLSLSNKIPHPNDHWDLEQVVYLNIADYYVTRDKILREWINNCGNIELKDRAISPEDFLKLNEEGLIIKRAPQPAGRFKLN